MRSLDDSNFGMTSCVSGALAADGLSFTHTGHTHTYRTAQPNARSDSEYRRVEWSTKGALHIIAFLGCSICALSVQLRRDS